MYCKHTLSCNWYLLVGVLQALGLTGVPADSYGNAMASQSLAALAEQGKFTLGIGIDYHVCIYIHLLGSYIC